MLKIENVVRLDLGVKAENMSRAIEIDCNLWKEQYPNGNINIYHQRPGETAMDVTGATYDNETGVLRWELTQTDTFIAGFGLAEIRLVEDNIVKKTATIVTLIHPSVVDESGGVIESNQQAYLDAASAIFGSTQQEAINAHAYAKDSEAWAKGTRGGSDVNPTDVTRENNAKYYAEQAGLSASSAQTEASLAVEKASVAAQKASQAAASAQSADSWRASASASAEAAAMSEVQAREAQTAANNAKEYVSSMAQSAEQQARQAAYAAASAGSYKNAAETSATNAAERATAAAASAEEAAATAAGIAAAGAAQIAAIEAKGEEVIDEIPDDYTDLSNTVNSVLDTSNIYAGLTNVGEYTLTADDFELGSWLYTKKTANNARARIKALIPVRKGMVLQFANNLFDVTANVWAENNNSSAAQTPVQAIGKLATKISTRIITADGWLSIVIMYADDSTVNINLADYDSIITVSTAANTGRTKNTSLVYASLANNGAYTIQTTDLESGQWGYGAKIENVARARTKHLIPIRSGMIINYDSQTYDLFFGVLDSPNGISYLQSNNWSAYGTGEYHITNDGYMTVIIRNHSDTSAEVAPAAFDGVITIKTAVANAIEETGNALDEMKDETSEAIAELRTNLEFAPENYQYNSTSASPYTILALPILYLDGDSSAMTKKNAVSLSARFKDIKMGCSVKWQGNSSVNFPKKNYTITFDGPVKIVDAWGNKKRYVLKSEYLDNTHTRNTVSARLWAQIVRDRETVNGATTLDDQSGTPITLEDGTTTIDIINSKIMGAPGCGANDGFHIMLVMNDKYMGLYTMGIPKEDWMFGMDNGAVNCAVLNAEKSCLQTKMIAPTTEADIDDENTFSIEYASDDMTLTRITNSVNTMISAVWSSIGTDYKQVIGPYFDLDNAMDYLIYSIMIGNWDGISHNYNLYTYDGVKWAFSAYDLDNTFGVGDLKDWSFTSLYDNPVELTPNLGIAAQDQRLLYIIKQYDKAAFKARYNYLRSGILSEGNVYTAFYNFIALVSKRVMAEEYNVWPETPRSGAQYIDAILNFYRLRCAYMDAAVGSL